MDATQSPPTPNIQFETVSFTLPPEYRERIERIAAEKGLNRSQVMRFVLASYFRRLDAAAARRVQPEDATPLPAPNGKRQTEKA